MFDSGALKAGGKVHVARFVGGNFEQYCHFEAFGNVLCLVKLRHSDAPRYCGPKKGLLTLCKKVQTIEASYIANVEASFDACP